MTFVRAVLFSAMLLAVPLSAHHNLAEICDTSKVVTPLPMARMIRYGINIHIRQARRLTFA